jgi:hypothetical protein
MKVYDFIKQALGKKVYLKSDGDLPMNRTFRKFCNDKTEFTLIGLTKAGMAIIEFDGNRYHVRPSNIKEALAGGLKDNPI